MLQRFFKVFLHHSPSPFLRYVALAARQIFAGPFLQRRQVLKRSLQWRCPVGGVLVKLSAQFSLEEMGESYGYINPYCWVDDHPLLYGNNGSLDPGTYDA